VKEVWVLFAVCWHAENMLNQGRGFALQGGQILSDAENGVVQTTVKVAVD